MQTLIQFGAEESKNVKKPRPRKSGLISHIVKGCNSEF